jgi:hypothetical protein
MRKWVILSVLFLLVVACPAIGQETAATGWEPDTLAGDSSPITLDAVVIKPKREKYSRKNNPAVRFARKVIEARDRYDPRRRHAYFSYERYEQLFFALNDFEPRKKGRKGNKPGKFDFLAEFVDTLETGTTVLPVLEKERVESVYYRRSPRAERRVVEGSRSAGVDEIFSRDGIQQFISESLGEVDVFQNDIPLLLQRFVSPLSTMGPLFYKYYLLDTLRVNGRKCIDLGFAPFNAESLGFVGHLYVALDSTYFVEKLVMNVPKDINLNFVSHMTIEQTFDRAPDTTRILKKDDLRARFKIIEKSKGYVLRRLNTYGKQAFLPPSGTYAGLFDEAMPSIVADGADCRTDSFWMAVRPEGARGTERSRSVEQLMGRLRAVPLFYYAEKFIGTLVSGYVPTHKDPRRNWFDLGPMNSTINGNAIEGARFRLGGGTTPVFSRHWFLEGYAAYGTRDGRLKYDALVEYSFVPRNEFRLEFPIHSLRFEYMYDLNKLGQNYLYTSKDNVMLAIRRKKDTRATYLRRAELTYTREHGNGFSYSAVLRHRREYATAYAPFDLIGQDGCTYPQKHYDQAELELNLRYARNEKFYQTRTQRIPITYDALELNLSHTMAKKGLLGTDFDYHHTEVGLRKRFWFSAFGYADLLVKAGKVWSKVPYPLLILPNANLTYTIQPEAYTNMNALEFINDEYLSWDLTYYLNGFLLNRVPLLQRLKWKEVFTFRGLWGHLTDKNNPFREGDSEGLYTFPEGSGTLGRAPYMEMGVGIDNIFKFLRIDYVWRLNDRDRTDVPSRGVRCTMSFSF